MNMLSLRFLSVTIALLLSISSLAQEENLSDRFVRVMAESETYEAYKVIRIDRLNTFWQVVGDSLTAYQNSISGLNSTVEGLEVQITEQNKQIDELNSSLNQSKTLNDSIDFLGITFEKWVYHAIVWIVIAGLLVASIFFFGMYKRSNLITERSVKELAALTSEYDDFKDKSREKQVKLKRELQTTVNTLEEVRRSKAVRSNVS